MTELRTMYVTDGTLKFGERNNDHDKKLEIRDKWTVITESDSLLCGNVAVVFDDDNIALLTDKHDKTRKRSYRQISSALALYRTISLFECGLNSNNMDFYKMNWQVLLKHRETNVVIGLGEWKGGFQIFTPYIKEIDLNPKYKADAEELLTLLVSPDMTIGYGGTIAGTVA